MWELINDPTFRTVLIGTASIGAISGALGCFSYLSREGLMGDVIAHCSLPGIMLAFLVSYYLTGQGSRSLWVLIPGAIVSGIASLWLTRQIVAHTRLKSDASLGVMLAIFFGSGIFLLRYIQRANPPFAGQRGLEECLFGMAATMTHADLWMIFAVGLLAIVVLTTLWPQLKVASFDAGFSRSLGLPMRRLEMLMMGLTVLGIVVGIQSVGVVLMVALLITPAAAARQWTRNLGPMLILASAIGGMCGAAGALISGMLSGVPTGPVIVLVATVIFAVSVTFAPHRGGWWRWQKTRISARQTAIENARGGSVATHSAKGVS